MPDVVCMGEILVEFVSNEPNVNLKRVNDWEAAAGGAPANVAVALSKLDRLSSAFCGCVGRDPLGDRLQETLERHGVNTSCLVRVDAQRTTLVFTAVHDDGHKELCFYRGADRYVKLDSAHSVWEDARCFHYGSISLIDQPGSQAQREAMDVARDKGLFLTYDPNYRPTLWPDPQTAHRVMLEASQYAHMVKISQEELEVVTGHQNTLDAARVILDQGVELVVISRGKNGAWATNGSFQVESPAMNDVPIIETTGSGDAFLAAMITRLLPEFEKLGGSLRNLNPRTVQAALDYANIVGGLTCTRAGAIPALPTDSQVENAMQATRGISNNLTQPPLDAKRLAGMIDHTMLKPYLSKGDIEKLCREARNYGFVIVAVNPANVEECCRLLAGSSVCVGAAIGFPLGQTTTAVKIYETRDALSRGATEIDMVLSVRQLQNGDYDQVRDEISGILQVCRDFGDQRDGTKIVYKVILETCYLTREEKIKACEICRDVGVDFVKTSTGFGSGGATVEDVRLMRSIVGPAIGVKASGGIRDLETAKAMIAAGATRIGTSSGAAIVDELLSHNKR